MTTTTGAGDEEVPESIGATSSGPFVATVELNDESTSSSASSVLPQLNMEASEDTVEAVQAISLSEDETDDVEGDDETDDCKSTINIKPVIVNRCRKRTAVPQNMGRNRHSLLKKDQCVLLDGIKFMAEFDPTNSSRNQQKKKKRYHPVDGRLIQYADDFDICDCLKPTCPGCHYPCKTCGDGRCGRECRVQRKWMYDSLEVDGRDKEIKNPHASAFV